MFEDLITSKTRTKILNTFLEEPDSMYHVREVVRRVDEEINAVRRELILLDKKGILKREPRANRVYYYLDKNYTFFEDLLRVHSKSQGIGAEIIKNKVKLGKIKFAMLNGKFAKKIKHRGEQVDILIIGTVVMPELTQLIKNEEQNSDIEINYTVMSEEEYDFRKKRRDPFLGQVVSGSRVMLIGNEEELIAD